MTIEYRIGKIVALPWHKLKDMTDVEIEEFNNKYTIVVKDSEIARRNEREHDRIWNAAIDAAIALADKMSYVTAEELKDLKKEKKDMWAKMSKEEVDEAFSKMMGIGISPEMLGVKDEGNVQIKNCPTEIANDIWNAALASIHIPNEMAVARTADKLKMDATKVAAVWMTMLEEMKK